VILIVNYEKKCWFYEQHYGCKEQGQIPSLCPEDNRAQKSRGMFRSNVEGLALQDDFSLAT